MTNSFFPAGRLMEKLPSKSVTVPKVVPFTNTETPINASPLSMGLLSERGVPAWHPAPKPLVEACRKAMEHCKAKNYPVEKLAMQFSVSNPRIATTLFSTTNPENVKKNIAFIKEPIDWELVREVQEIIGEQKRVSWANS